MTWQLRIRPGVQRDDAGRWRPICHIWGPAPGEFREYLGEWLEGDDAEARAVAVAREIAAKIRSEFPGR